MDEAPASGSQGWGPPGCYALFEQILNGSPAWMQNAGPDGFQRSQESRHWSQCHLSLAYG